MKIKIAMLFLVPCLLFLVACPALKPEQAGVLVENSCQVYDVRPPVTNTIFEPEEQLHCSAAGCLIYTVPRTNTSSSRVYHKVGCWKDDCAIFEIPYRYSEYEPDYELHCWEGGCQVYTVVKSTNMDNHYHKIGCWKDGCADYEIPRTYNLSANKYELGCTRDGCVVYELPNTPTSLVFFSDFKLGCSEEKCEMFEVQRTNPTVSTVQYKVGCTKDFCDVYAVPYSASAFDYDHLLRCSGADCRVLDVPKTNAFSPEIYQTGCTLESCSIYTLPKQATIFNKEFKLGCDALSCNKFEIENRRTGQVGCPAFQVYSRKPEQYFELSSDRGLIRE